jgi:pectate lyase
VSLVAGVGLPSTRAYSRDSLMRHRNGYAADVTGGYDGDDIWVTSTASTGAGTLQEAMQTVGPAWIRFDPSIHGQTITFTSSAHGGIYPHKTIDARGTGVVIGTDSLGLVMTTNASEKGNVIIAGLTFDGITRSSGADAIRISNDVTTLEMGPTWVTHCTFRDVWDGMIDFTCVTNGVPERLLTVDWCEFGPSPSDQAIAESGGPIDWDDVDDNSVLNGKVSLLGANSEGIVNAANALLHKVTWHHNYHHGTLERNPFVRAAVLHMYNCYIKNFGYPYSDGSTKGKGIQAATHGNVRVENTIIGQYDVGEAHEADGTLVTHPCLDAIYFAPAYDGLSQPQVLHDGCVLKSGLVAQTQNEDNVVTPPYDYELDATTEGDDLADATNAALAARIVTLAGAH